MKKTYEVMNHFARCGEVIPLMSTQERVILSSIERLSSNNEEIATGCFAHCEELVLSHNCSIVQVLLGRNQVVFIERWSLDTSL